MKNPTLPLSALSRRARQTLVEGLPDSPGVYLFYGSRDELLYVGKSKSIRTRVRSHFSSCEEEHLCRQVHHINARTTAGELGALLLESQLIKELRPIYNIRARRKRNLVVATARLTTKGYLMVVLDEISHFDLGRTSSTLGIFKHRLQAKEYLIAVAKSHSLCHKLLGLENTKRHCFSFHLGQCKGACAGLEDPDRYNARVQNAFAERRLKAWPYEGAVLIEERGEDNNTGEVFIVDNWCLLYSFTYSLGKFSLHVKGTYRFDYDSYKILSSYIFDHDNRNRMTVVGREDMLVMVRHARETGEFPLEPRG